MKCLGLDDLPVDHRFTITFTDVRSSYRNRPMAYLLANGFRGTVYDLGTFNSSGAANSITRTGTGAYVVRLPNLAAAGGHVQVTAWPGYDGWRLCKVLRWVPSGSDQLVDVRCYDRFGAAVDVNFTLTYVNQRNILGLSTGFDPDGHDSAYAWANEPSTASYRPDTSYQFRNFTNTAATGTRTATGTYAMMFASSNPDVGTAHVTAYGDGTRFYGIAHWSERTGIQVRCYALDGSPADSSYTIAFSGPFMIG